MIDRCWLPSGDDSWVLLIAVLHENLSNSNLAAVGLLGDPFSCCLHPVHLLRLGARWPDRRRLA